jgi:hypothetical protein
MTYEADYQPIQLIMNITLNLKYIVPGVKLGLSMELFFPLPAK